MNAPLCAACIAKLIETTSGDFSEICELQKILYDIDALIKSSGSLAADNLIRLNEKIQERFKIDNQSSSVKPHRG